MEAKNERRKSLLRPITAADGGFIVKIVNDPEGVW